MPKARSWLLRTTLYRSLYPRQVARSLGAFRKYSDTAEVVQEGDFAILQYRDNDPFLTPKLKRNGTINTRWGSLPHEALFGKSQREAVTTNKGRRLGVRIPTLSEYVTLTPRLVTPIYPADANLIVSLLDIHPDTYSVHSEGPFVDTLEILEAGTGHGALTLHLARAIHSANASGHQDEDSSQSSTKRLSVWRRLKRYFGNPRTLVTSSSRSGVAKHAQRPAVIHSVEISSRHSDHARKILQGFRKGLYASDVDFHVGNVSDWLDQRIEERTKHGINGQGTPFLSHAFLDLPNSHRHLRRTAEALKTNGNLVVLNPSITQIVEGVEIVKRERLPLVLDRVLELGHTVTGGREWDVRTVIPRKENQGKKVVAETADEGEPSSVVESESSDENSDLTLDIVRKDVSSSISETTEERERAWQMVCRPKVGVRLTGGAFIGIWKKMRLDQTPR